MIKALVFDLDGTLLNTLSALRLSVSLTMQALGLGELDEEHTKAFVGEGYQKLLERSLVYLGDEKMEKLQESMSLYQKFFQENCMEGVHPYEGILQLLDYGKKKGLKLAVLSNKLQHRVEDNIFQIFGKEMFDRVYGERPGIPMKPDPTGLKLLIQELQAAPKEVLYMGDTDTDINTGQGAGVNTVGVAWGFRSREVLEACRPDYLVNSPEEIISLLQSKELIQWKQK